ncbi:MAG: DUF5680 domain-containing protein [archaeon]
MENFEKALIDFIVFAKRNSYAKSGEGGEKKNPDGSKELSLKKGNFSYSDRYYGSRQFSGIETVFFKEVPVWSMVYTGAVVVAGGGAGGEIWEKKGSPFLKKCLGKVTPAAPFRGPEHFSSGKFSYENRLVGNFSFFSGSEAIRLDRKVIFVLSYSGGLVKK